MRNPLPGCLPVLLFFVAACPVLHAQREQVVGLNTSFMNDWASVIYADALKQRRIWTRPTDGEPAATNVQGHPLEDANAYLSGSLPLRAGVYRIYHNGNFTLSISRGVLGTFSTDPATGLKVATWTLDARMGGTEARVRDVVVAPTIFAIMRPVVEGSPESHSLEELTDRVYAASVGQAEVLRYMDTLETNANPSVSWAERIRPDQYPRQVNLQGAGQPLEHIVRMSHDTGTDPWINIPHQADDEYILNVARLLRYGSDGVVPFASDSAREAAVSAGQTVYPPLDPARRIYLEYSNEVWNSLAAFNQTAWVQNAALMEVAANPSSALNYDNPSPTSSIYGRTMQARYYVRRAVFISETFRAVFGDDAMMSRVRPMLLWQQNNSNSHGSLRLAYLTDYYGRVNPGNPVARPPSYYFWGAGAGGYYSPADGVTELADLWDSGNMNPETWRERLVTDGALALGCGLRYVIYEGGPGFGPDNGSRGSHPLAEAAVKDPLIVGEINEHHDLFNRYGGGFFCYFQHQGGEDAWNWTFDFILDDPITYKKQAFNALGSRLRPPEDRSLLLPATLPGASFSAAARRASSAPSPSPSGAFTVNDGEWVVYDVRSLLPGEYSIVTTYSGGAAGRTLEFWADGVLLGTASATSPTSATTPAFTFSVLGDRRHSLRVRVLGGSAVLLSHTFESVGVVPTALLSPPEGTVLSPLETVTATGLGTSLSWSVSPGTPSSGSGPAFSFTVPSSIGDGATVLLTLSGAGGVVSRGYTVRDLAPSIVTPGVLPSGAVGSAYTTPLTASSGDGPHSWSVISGALPSGLSLSSSGQLSGTPASAGFFTFSARVADADGDADEREFTLFIAGPPAPLENGGVLSLEVESATLPDPADWQVHADAGASGSSYLAPITGKHQTGTAPNSSDPARFASLPFGISTAGEYVLHVRMAVPPISGGGNSFFYRIDGGAWLTFNDRVTSTAWTWGTYDTSRLHSLAPGLHLLEFTWRERETRLDKFVFQLAGLAAPTDTGPVASPVVSASEAFEVWMGQFFAGTPADPLADPDADGMTNLLEYALAGDPLAPDPGLLPQVSGESPSPSQLSISFPRLRPELTYLVESSEDLAAWTPLATNPGQPGEQVTVSTPIAPATRKFLRLRVSQ